MARPRIFISSTFYDLKHVREDVERAVRDLGYEPVRNETGTIPYGKEHPPETYAYKELEMCDIIVSIIGGRYGSESRDDEGHSITQAELRRAIERGIQVFIFIDKNVLSEFSTYMINKSNESIKYRFVDDIRVYQFIENLYKLPKNNPISPFETSADITEYLRVQWAGLFQRFLQDKKRHSELKVLDEMKSISETLQQLVQYLTKERENKDEAIRSILFANHPAFRAFAEVTNAPYRIYFSNLEELNTWMAARRWTPPPPFEMDEDSVLEWISSLPDTDYYIKLKKDIFDDDQKLKPYSDQEWSDDWVTAEQIPVPAATNNPFGPDDDLPF